MCTASGRASGRASAEQPRAWDMVALLASQIHLVDLCLPQNRVEMLIGSQAEF